MLTYSFADKGSESLYEHLYGCIKNDIAAGKLLPGTKLPSKRTFAKNLGISTITVENAYSLLLSEGYIYSVPKKGYYVSDIKPGGQAAAAAAAPSEPEAVPQYAADFVSNRTLYTLFPFATWAKLIRRVISEKSRELMRSPLPGGIVPLRRAIADHLYEFRGMEVKPEHIIVGSGTEYLYGLIIQLLGHNRLFALEDPGYGKIAAIYRANGVKCAHIPLDGSGVDVRRLRESGAEILHISPSHHFPTGIVTPISRRYELLSWASEDPSHYIIEDDYDSELRLTGKPIPTLRSIDVTDKVIYMNTFTKSLASTIRISYMILPAALSAEFYKRLGFYSCTVSTFEQYTLAEFISGGYFGNHINRARRYYREQRDAILAAISATPALQDAQIMEEDAGLHFILRLNTPLSDSELRERALRRGINISFLSQYYSNPADAAQHMAVINYSGIEKEAIPGAIRLLGECLK